ncbi:hypothetical protein DFH06DRAFT_1150312 [Mycena polygramma]|nr:hypothetical protein DFH06DRAFT_1150312 [Mycena polygramma]
MHAPPPIIWDFNSGVKLLLAIRRALYTTSNCKTHSTHGLSSAVTKLLGLKRRIAEVHSVDEVITGRVLLLVPYHNGALPASTSTDSQSEFADLPFLVDGLQSTAGSPACETVPLLAYISHPATIFTTLAAHTPSSASLRNFGNFYGQTRIFFRGSIGIRGRRGNPEPGLPGAARMVCRVSSNSPRTHRMRMVRGRKEGTADGMTDDREAGTGAAMAGRNSHGLSQCHVGAAKRPGGQGGLQILWWPGLVKALMGEIFCKLSNMVAQGRTILCARGSVDEVITGCRFAIELIRQDQPDEGTIWIRQIRWKVVPTPEAGPFAPPSPPLSDFGRHVQSSKLVAHVM